MTVSRQPLTARIIDERIARHILEDLGQFDPVGPREEQPEDVGPADHRDAFAAGKPKRIVRIARDLRAFGPPISIPVSTMWRRPGSRPGRLSNVFRPMTIALPIVSALNRLRSAGRCHGSLPSRPITPFCARATMRVMNGLVHMRSFDAHRADMPSASDDRRRRRS